MNAPYEIRHAQPGDLTGVLTIYNHYVEHTPITFDLVPQTEAQKRPWFESFATSGRHQFFVAERDGQILGYAYTGTFRDRAAYDGTVECTVYLAPGQERQGMGRALYARLFDAVRDQGVHRIIAGATLPNPGSVALHESMGFQKVGIYTEVGFKFDQYWDVIFWELKVEPTVV